MKFFIDFENVGCNGLTGIEDLLESDIVAIYYSNNPNLNMDTVMKMFQSKAKIKFYKLSDEIKNMNLKNALDIVILYDISRPSNNQCADWMMIVSNDSGYDNAINSFAENGMKLKRITSISKAPKTLSLSAKNGSAQSKTNEQKITELFKKELSEFISHQQYIINVIMSSKTRSQINNTLTKKFPANTGKIMKAIKPYIKHLPGQ